MAKDKAKQYIYIAQADSEPSWCKIGLTDNLDRRLKEYNSKNVTGIAKKVFSYLFTCEVSNMRQVENDIKKEFITYREVVDREMYLFNPLIFKKYLEFIKAHSLFIEEIVFHKVDETIKKIVEVEKIIKKTTPSLKSRGKTPNEIMNRAGRVANDEFYTRYEDVEKEIAMYDKNIWKDKVVFCNCDDAVDENDDRKTSAFALYFIRNFKELGLKKLICTTMVKVK